MESSPKGDTIEAEADGSSQPSAMHVNVGELRAVADLHHPHLVPMHRASSGSGYEVEHPVGISLTELTTDGKGSPALRVRVRILLDALSGLAALHRAKLDGKLINFVHGEVAPHNIVVASDGIGRLIPLVDSHWSNPPVPASVSLGYVAPERLLGDVFDQRADIFSIGVLLWEAIAERRLFHNQRMDAIVTQLVGNKISRPPPPPDSPWADALADVAMQALAVDPADRWPHVGVMGAEIENIAQGFLPTSKEIASILRQRSGDRTSSIPAGDRPTYAPTGDAVYRQGAPFPEDGRISALPGLIESNAGRTSAIPMSGGIAWHGPSSARQPADASRDGARQSAPAMSVRSRRNSREVVRRQSRIVWTAVGVGLALFGITAYELLERDAPAPSAAVPTPDTLPEARPAPDRRGAPTPPAAAPAPAPAPRAMAPTTNNAPSEAPATHARTAIESGRPLARPSTPAAPQVQRAQSVTPKSTPAPAPPPAPSAPPVVSAAPPAPPPPPEPVPDPTPKAKDDPFGI